MIAFFSRNVYSEVVSGLSMRYMPITIVIIEEREKIRYVTRD